MQAKKRPRVWGLSLFWGVLLCCDVISRQINSAARFKRVPRLHKTGEASASPGVICRGDVYHGEIGSAAALEYLPANGDPGDVVN